MIEELLTYLTGGVRPGAAGGPSEALAALVRGLGAAGTGGTASGGGALQSLLSQRRPPTSAAASPLAPAGAIAGGALGLAGLALGRLFRREPVRAAEENRPVRYERPETGEAVYGVSGDWSSAGMVDYFSDGRPRLDARARNVATPVVVQIQALDSRSILDRSEEIADALRKAMLNSHPLSETLSE